MGFQGAFSYLPGSVAQSAVSGAPAGVGGAAGPLDLTALNGILGRRIAAKEADDAATRAVAQQRAQLDLEALRTRLAAEKQAAIPQERPSMAGRGEAMDQASRGTPVFTKTVGGAGMTGGTIRLNQWEPGASFAGWSRDLGMGPANASVQAPGASGASLAASPPSNQPWSGGYSAGGSYPMAGGPSGAAPPAGGGAVGPGADFARGMLANAAERSNREIDARSEAALRGPIDTRRLLETLIAGGGYRTY